MAPKQHKALPPVLAVVTVVLAVATVVAILRIGAIAETVPLQFALDADGAADALKDESLAAVRTAVAWDFVLPLLYVPLLCICVAYAMSRFYVIRAAHEWGKSLIFVAIVAGGADYAENALHLWLLSGVDHFTATGQWQAVWASSFAVVKFIGLALVIAYIVPAAIWGVWLMLSRFLPWQVRVQDLPSPGDTDSG